MQTFTTILYPVEFIQVTRRNLQKCVLALVMVSDGESFGELSNHIEDLRLWFCTSIFL